MNQYMSYLVAWMNVKFGVNLTAEREEGQGLVEYALIIVLVSIASIVALTALGGQVVAVFNQMAAAL